MFNAIAYWIGEIIDLVGSSPAEHIGSDDAKPLRKIINVVFPGDLGGGAVFAAVQQDKVGTLSRFEEMGFDLPDVYDSVLVRRHMRSTDCPWLQNRRCDFLRPGGSVCHPEPA